jgi:phospholipid/cholesterol/gamma-HCH transport system permease protein
MKPELSSQAEFELLAPVNGVLAVRMRGDWIGYADATSGVADAILEVAQGAIDLKTGGLERIEFDGTELGNWDSRTLIGIDLAVKVAGQLGIELHLGSLPNGLQRLLRLSQAVPPRGERREAEGSPDMLILVGQSTLRVGHSLSDANLFLGQSLQSVWRFIRGRARFMRSDIAEFIQATGPQALPIVGIINVLLGVILGFMGAVQLQQFGAQIYVADLVALGQTREIAPIISATRTVWSKLSSTVALFLD